MFRNDSKGFSWPLGLHFTQKITLICFLNNVKKSEMGLELVDYDGEYELLLITSWMAEWSGAPPLPPCEAGGAGDRFPPPPQ